MLMDLRTRQRQPELMDAQNADPVALARSLRFIRRVNSVFGYTRATLRYLEQFSRHWRRGQRIDIIDLATGSADIPRAILRWASRHGFDVHVTAVDRHPLTMQYAAEDHADPRLHLVRADVMNLPFDAGSFDYAITAMFLHHLDEEDVVRVLRTMSRIARQGIIVSDLLRHRRAYAWISAFTLLANPMARHDARASVAQAFTGEEILALAGRAGLTFAAYHRHFAHRFVLAGEK